MCIQRRGALLGRASHAATICSLLAVLGVALAVPVVSAAPPVYQTEPSVSPEAAPTGSRIFLPIVRAAPAAPIFTPGDGSVLQGWFWARPGDGTTTPQVAQNATWITLTRGHNRWLEELRRAGFQGQALEYLIGMEVQGPGPYADSTAACDGSHVPANNTAAYNRGDFCTYIHPNESWFVHNGRGERLYLARDGGNGVDYQMDPASEGWRAFMRERATRDLLGDGQQAALGFDGVLFDNIPLRLYKLKNQTANSDGVVREYDSDERYRAAVVDFLRYQRAALSTGGKKLWGSLIDFYGVPAEEYLRITDQLDGYMSEAWGPGYVGRSTTAERWNEILAIAETTLEQGKGLMAVVQGEQGDHTRQTFGLASYLLISDGQQAHFRYAYLREPYTEWWQYSNYGVKLGAPKGARYKSGNLWRRDFRCGYVAVDPVAERGEIVQSACAGSEPAEN